MEIAVYCNDGSPLTIIPEDIYGRGVGGAELSLITWAEYMVARGHKVSIYNNPRVPGEYTGVEYLPQRAFDPKAARDALIVWRSPFPQLRVTNGDYVKVHWSTDQYTVGNYTKDILPFVDGVVTISPFHRDYYTKRYAAGGMFENITYIDLGVRQLDYTPAVKKQRYEMIWASVPDRGLDLLLQTWGKIKERIPQAHLSITSDYSLWGGRAIGVQRHKPQWTRYADSVDYLGNIARSELVKLQMRADIALGSFTYDELFCISSAEAQYTGAISMTGDRGALPTTNKGGVVIPMRNIINRLPADIETIYNSGEIDQMQKLSRDYARLRFDWDYICQKWEHIFTTGSFTEGQD